MKRVGLRLFLSTVVTFITLTTLCTHPANAFAADITVSSPAGGSVVNSPFLVEASSSTCLSQPTASMAYSIDSGTDTVFKPATSINQSVSASQGSHTLLIKAWGNAGAFCKVSISITVGTGVQVSSPVNGSTVPSSFLLQASAPSCGGQSTSSMAYSFDSNSDNLLQGATSINKTVSASSGNHILRVKAWGNSGAFCETELNINVSADSVVINTPGNNATVPTTFLLKAQAPSCNGLSTTSMAFNFSGYSDTVLSGAQSINQNVTAPKSGPLTLNAKAWNGQGNLCETSVSITVDPNASSITISSPTDSNVSMSFPLQAQATTCQGSQTSSMAYSFDSLSDHLFSGQTSISTTATAPGTGPHTLHVKAWNTSGGLCESNMDLNVIDNGLQPGSTQNAFTQIELLGDYPSNNDSYYYYPCPNQPASEGHLGATQESYHQWQTQPDCGTYGNKSGTTSKTSPPAAPPSGDTTVRQYTINNSSTDKSGPGVRWFVALCDSSQPTACSNDDTFTHFQYDTWVYLDQNATTGIENLEMDLNQTVGTGSPYLYIFATQCRMDPAHHDWQLGNHWPLIPDNVPCPTLQPGWHHFQIQFHRGPNAGDPITFDAEALDGTVHNFATCNGGSACSIGVSTSSWGSEVLGPNFQVDVMQGYSSVTSYADQFTIYRW